MSDINHYINEMIGGGYLSSDDLEPIRCHWCNSYDIYDTNHIIEELGTHIVTEYMKKCRTCDREIGYWAYGYWQI